MAGRLDWARVAFCSDLHAEMLDAWGLPARPWPGREPWPRHPLRGIPDLGALERPPPHLLLVAGDAGLAVPPLGRACGSMDLLAGLRERLGCPVLFVPGNHEYYGADFRQALEGMRRGAPPGVFVLDRDEWRGTLGGVPLRVLGATLWTDYRVSGDQTLRMRACLHGLNDHARISLDGGPWLPVHALEEPRTSAAWLADRLTEPFEGATLVATHHVPHSAFRNPRFPVDHISGGFMSDLDGLIGAAAEAGVAAWVFGHHHHCVVAEALGVPFLSAQLGYAERGERTGWAGPRTVRVTAAGPALLEPPRP